MTLQGFAQEARSASAHSVTASYWRLQYGMRFLVSAARGRTYSFFTFFFTSPTTSCTFFLPHTNSRDVFLTSPTTSCTFLSSSYEQQRCGSRFSAMLEFIVRAETSLLGRRPWLATSQSAACAPTITPSRLRKNSPEHLCNFISATSSACF